jgi:hypothetical protein
MMQIAEQTAAADRVRAEFDAYPGAPVVATPNTLGRLAGPGEDDVRNARRLAS